MGRNTNIDWTDHTWNPWQGCRKVSPGCANCYMFRDKKRYGQDPAKVIRSKPRTFNFPLRIKEPGKVFVCSWSDFFIFDADPWRDEAWDIMRMTPHLTYLLLTKRPENIADRLPEDWCFQRNIWIGVTVENQEMADKRLPILAEIPAPIKFVSIEPMVGPVDLSKHNNSVFGFDWVIVGGETGPGAREIDTKWAQDVLNHCRSTGNTAFFMKQMTNKAPVPEDLNIRQFPGG